MPEDRVRAFVRRRGWVHGNKRSGNCCIERNYGACVNDRVDAARSRICGGIRLDAALSGASTDAFVGGGAEGYGCFAVPDEEEESYAEEQRAAVPRGGL